MKAKPLFWLVLAANLIGAAYGFLFFYGTQLSSTNPLLWVFVADCPLYALLFAACLLLLRAGRNPQWFLFLVSAGAVKYGIWTIFVLLYFPQFYFAPAAALLYFSLLIAHLGLLAEPMLFAGRVAVSKSCPAIALAWLLLNDFADYALALHPPLPQGSEPFMAAATVAMTLASCAPVFLLFRAFKRPIFTLFVENKA
ncbi:MAG: DUF1405 domain-containing protein [Candidatus Diapherotrites archaeon]